MAFHRILIPEQSAFLRILSMRKWLFIGFLFLSNRHFIGFLFLSNWRCFSKRWARRSIVKWEEASVFWCKSRYSFRTSSAQEEQGFQKQRHIHARYRILNLPSSMLHCNKPNSSLLNCSKKLHVHRFFEERDPATWHCVLCNEIVCKNRPRTDAFFPHLLRSCSAREVRKLIGNRSRTHLSTGQEALSAWWFEEIFDGIFSRLWKKKIN